MVYRFCTFWAHAALTCLATISFVATSTGLYGADYPVILTSHDELVKLGIGYLEFPNKCFAGINRTISISNELFARFKSRGFTVESMCLGLLSQTRYDPETGRRLPTYIYVDTDQLARSLREDPAGLGADAVDEEAPLDLPDCFKNGTPYIDCVFRFGRLTGKALTPAETATYAKLGAGIDKWANAQIATGNVIADQVEDCDGVRPCEELGFKRMDPAPVSESGDVGIDAADSERLYRYSSAQHWVRSSKLPRGYGYVLDWEGALDSGASADTVKAAMDNLSKPQINVEELRRRLNAR